MEGIFDSFGGISNFTSSTKLYFIKIFTICYPDVTFSKHPGQLSNIFSHYSSVIMGGGEFRPPNFINLIKHDLEIIVAPKIQPSRPTFWLGFETPKPIWARLGATPIFGPTQGPTTKMTNKAQNWDFS